MERAAFIMCCADNNQVSKSLKKKMPPLGSSPSETTLFVESKYFRPLVGVGQTFLRTVNSKGCFESWEAGSLLRKGTLWCRRQIEFSFEFRKEASILTCPGPLVLWGFSLFLSLFFLLNVFQSSLWTFCFFGFFFFSNDDCLRWPDFFFFYVNRKTAQIKRIWTRLLKSEASA